MTDDLEKQANLLLYGQEEEPHRKRGNQYYRPKNVDKWSICIDCRRARSASSGQRCRQCYLIEAAKNRRIKTQCAGMRRALLLIGTQKEMAKQLGIDQSIVSRMLNGKIGVPSRIGYQISKLTGGLVDMNDLACSVEDDVNSAFENDGPVPVVSHDLDGSDD